jgi:hypothetical protein
MTVILDAGALIGIDRRDRTVGAILRVAQQQRVPVRTSAAALAQVWRGGARQANLARTLPGIDTLPLDQSAASRIGELLGNAHTSDIVDGHVALITGAGDTVLTSDLRDIRRLLTTRQIQATLAQV